MITLDLNSNGDVIAYADLQVFRSYISAALTMWFAAQINETPTEDFFTD